VDNNYGPIFASVTFLGMIELFSGFAIT